jgi:ubiquinone/menaquinone biosynthesis C-methylase UbiE
LTQDPYLRIAPIYDRLFEPMNGALRVLGLRMFLPPRGGAILDVGCGTGMHLEIYKRYDCKLAGVDTSPAMLGLARARLGESADLRRGDAADMPFADRSFDLVICMLALHEMEASTRSAVLQEIARVAKADGRVLLIDFHSGPARPLKGWLSKLVIMLAEIGAGRRHFRNYRHFMSIGGLPRLIDDHRWQVEKTRVVGDDTMALYLVRPAT